MLDQEIASIMRYIIDSAGKPQPYYHRIPQDFLVPAVYFPPPEIDSQGDTLATFTLSHVMYVKFFHSSTPLAYGMGMVVLVEIQCNRRLIPLIDEAGELTGRGVRIHDPKLRELSGTDGAAQLELSWDAIRPYRRAEPPKVMTVHVDAQSKAAYAAAVDQLNRR